MGETKVASATVTQISDLDSPSIDSSSMNRPFNPPPETQNLIQSNQLTRSTRLWRSSSIMYLFLFVGVAGAISHHAFYASLAGKEAVGQLRMMRFGAALSYLTKAALVASVILAYRQQVWSTCSRKALSVSAIDSLFAAGSDIRGLFNLDIYLKAKVAVFLAGIVWLTPLAVILTPATLTVEQATMTNKTYCSSVRTINFDPEATNNWREGKKLSGMITLALSYWNTTGTNVSDPNTFDYYTSPSSQLKQTALLSTYLQQVVSNASIAADVCGSGWNCSYTIDFQAPGYQCTQLASGRNDSTNRLAQMGAPFDTNSLLPDGNFSYYAQTSLGDYSPIQIDAGSAGIPLQPPPFPKNLGAFRTEPVLWVGQSVLAAGNDTLPINSTDPRWYSAFVPKIFSCEHRLTNYTVLFNYTSNQQNTTVLKREFLDPIINTTYVSGDLADGTLDTTTASPQDNYVFPQDVERYRVVGAYHSLGAMLRQFINGTIFLSNTITPITDTEATKTKLIDPHSYLPAVDLEERIQQLYENIILSLLSNPQFLAVAWAGDPKQESTVGTNTGPEATYPCIKSRTFNHFVYHAWQLWLVYGLSILLALLGVIFGTVAIAQNSGVMHDMRFSTIVKASRARSLDDLPWKGGRDETVKKDMLQTKLRYGVFPEDGGATPGTAKTPYVGFGYESELHLPLGRMSTTKRVLSIEPWPHTSY